jgi:uncharacterized membrane protein YcaP (DUF421 family)
MDPITTIDFARIFFGGQPYLFFVEVGFRVLIVFAFALIFLRAGGKRARKQLTPVEMLIVVALGSAVGDAMVYSDTPLIPTLLIIITVIVLQFGAARLKRRSDSFEKFVNSRPNMFIKEGKILHDALEAENYTLKELESELRMKGVRDIGEVEYAYLELGGGLSVFKYAEGQGKDTEKIIPVPEEDGFMKV